MASATGSHLWSFQYWLTRIPIRKTTTSPSISAVTRSARIRVISRGGYQTESPWPRAPDPAELDSVTRREKSEGARGTDAPARLQCAAQRMEVDRVTRARRLLGVVLTTLAWPAFFATAASAAGPGPVTNVVNGLPSSDWPSVALLDTGTGTCTVTFIGCRTVLSAAHCVCSAGGSGPACPNGTFLLDPQSMFVFLQHAGSAFTVTDVRVAPGYFFGIQDDVAVLELDFPVRGVRPSRINTIISPFLGSSLTIVGFGRAAANTLDSGLKRSGRLTSENCFGAGVPNSSHVCWSFDRPLGPPGDDSTSCFGDSGGPLFFDFGTGPKVVGVQSGVTNACSTPSYGFATDVFEEHTWIEDVVGADLDADRCGDGSQVGDMDVTTWSVDGLVSSQAFHSFSVATGTKLLTVSLNAELGATPNDFDLYVKYGAPPTLSDFDCSSIFAGTLETCALPDPAAGTWHVLVDAFAGSGSYQANAAMFPPNPSPPALAPGELVVTDFVGWELMQVDRSLGDRAVASSPLRGTGPDLAAPEGVGVDGTGSLAVANLQQDNLLRVDPATGDRTLLSGCADAACTSILGSGPAFLGPRSVALQTDQRLIVTDRSSPPVSALLRVDPASGDRTLLSGCADPSCGSIVGAGPAFDRVLGTAVEPGGSILVADRFAVLRVDPDTGDRSVLSGCSDASCTSQVGSGPSFGEPVDVAVGYDGDILVTDSADGSAFRAVFRVDPVDGTRTVLSGCADPGCSTLVGSGTGFSDELGGIGVDPSSDIWVADQALAAVIRVDPVTGNRTIASGCLDASCAALSGSGTQFTEPFDVVVLPEPSPWLSLAAALALLWLLGRARGRAGTGGRAA